MGDYYALSAAFADWDSVAVAKNARSLADKLKALPAGDITADSIARDSVVIDVVREMSASAAQKAEGIISDTGWTAKRKNLNTLTQDFYDLLRTVKYDSRKLYLQRCPMAFNDTESGDWITDKGKDSIHNPYLGKHHPKYGDAMLDCGENQSVIDFQKQ